jgi:hypothetical protein
MREVTLYTTAGCHLCEMAEEVLHACGVQFTPVDIADTPELIERYGGTHPGNCIAIGQGVGMALRWQCSDRFSRGRYLSADF